LVVGFFTYVLFVVGWHPPLPISYCKIPENKTPNGLAKLNDIDYQVAQEGRLACIVLERGSGEVLRPCCVSAYPHAPGVRAAQPFQKCHDNPPTEDVFVGETVALNSSHMLRISIKLNLPPLNYPSTFPTAHPIYIPATIVTGHFCHSLSQSNGIGTAPSHAPTPAPTAAPNTSSKGLCAESTSSHLEPSMPCTYMRGNTARSAR